MFSYENKYPGPDELGRDPYFLICLICNRPSTEGRCRAIDQIKLARDNIGLRSQGPTSYIISNMFQSLTTGLPTCPTGLVVIETP